MKRTLSLLHPFTAQAIGVEEKDLYFYHSKPHENAFRVLQLEGYNVSIDYFTGHILPYRKDVYGIKKVFWPVTKPLLNNRHIWRKQESYVHLIFNKIKTPDVTIINMSGHGSRYCFKLANQIKRQGKSYIAMVGGLHMSHQEEAKDYYQNAHHIIVHTQFQKNQLKQQAAYEKIEIRVVPLGVNTQVFQPIKRVNDKIKLLYVGRISRLKQVEKTIESLDFLVNVKKYGAHLEIIGPISDKVYFDELKSLVKRLELEKYVSFLGSLEQEKLIPYYQKASVLLLPSKHESFGMVMVEAMSCGTPVIGLKGAGGPDEIIEHGVNGFLCSASDFNENVFELLRSKALLLKFNANCRKIAQNKWSLEHTTNCFRMSVENVFKS